MKEEKIHFASRNHLVLLWSYSMLQSMSCKIAKLFCKISSFGKLVSRFCFFSLVQGSAMCFSSKRSLTGSSSSCWCFLRTLSFSTMILFRMLVLRLTHKQVGGVCVFSLLVLTTNFAFFAIFVMLENTQYSVLGRDAGGVLLSSWTACRPIRHLFRRGWLVRLCGRMRRAKQNCVWFI